MTTDRLPHLIVEGFFATEKYTAKQGFGPDYPLPARDRSAHGNSVKLQLEKIRGENEQKRGADTTEDEPESSPVLEGVNKGGGSIRKVLWVQG